MNKLIAITGGIGAGKSVVSRILAVMGYPVYDTDLSARRIMDTSLQIKNALVREFGLSVVVDGNIDRKRLAEIVFNDKKKLEKLNSLVHGAVIDDIKHWRSACYGEICFVETAILYESRLDALVDEVWEVTAPYELRIGRIIDRSGGNMTRHEAVCRIRSQAPDPYRQLHPHTVTVVNDGLTALLPQIQSLLCTK